MTLQISESMNEYSSSVMNSVMASRNLEDSEAVSSKLAIPLLVLALNAAPMGIDISAISANNFSSDLVSYSILPEESHSTMGYRVDFSESSTFGDKQGVMDALTGFASNMLDGMVPLDPEFAAAMDEEFWDLV